MPLFATYVFLMIWMRNAIAPVVGTSLYANWLNHRQQYYIGRLTQNVDRENPLAATAFMQRTSQGRRNCGVGAARHDITEGMCHYTGHNRGD